MVGEGEGFSWYYFRTFGQFITIPEMFMRKGKLLENSCPVEVTDSPVHPNTIASNSTRDAWTSWYLHRHKEKYCEHASACCTGEG